MSGAAVSNVRLAAGKKNASTDVSDFTGVRESISFFVFDVDGTKLHGGGFAANAGRFVLRVESVATHTRI